jgi:toxin FitB
VFLLDTVTFCEPTKRRRNEAVMRWLATMEERTFYLSVVTVGEVERGIAAAAPQHPLAARRLRRWLEESVAGYGDRVLPLDLEAARVWGRGLHRRCETSPDLLIAATALRHGLTVATRNVRDFAPTGVPVVNPWEADGSAGG